MLRGLSLPLLSQFYHKRVSTSIFSTSAGLRVCASGLLLMCTILIFKLWTMLAFWKSVPFGQDLASFPCAVELVVVSSETFVARVRTSVHSCLVACVLFWYLVTPVVWVPERVAVCSSVRWWWPTLKLSALGLAPSGRAVLSLLTAYISVHMFYFYFNYMAACSKLNFIGRTHKIYLWIRKQGGNNSR